MTAALVPASGTCITTTCHGIILDVSLEKFRHSEKRLYNRSNTGFPMQLRLLYLTVLLTVASCDARKQAASEHQPEEPPPPSHELAANFPLFPVIEKNLWRQLLEAEREAAAKEVERLVNLLRTRHPFKAGEDSMELGGITYDRKARHLRIPAKVEFPNSADDRHPGEVELLLCTTAGRLHETLFTAEVRPLHLELLLHLAGHAKGAEPSRFRIDVLTGDGTRIPVDTLVRSSGGEPLESPLLWEFSGSDYRDLYSPDLSGDLAIFWHAHDSVLRIAHQGIASGEVKLLPVPHPALKNGQPVTLQLVPQ